MAQIESSYKETTTLDDFMNFIEEIEEQCYRRANTRREYYALLLCKDGKVRNVKVVEEKKEAEKWGPRFHCYTETDNGIIPASYDDIINIFFKH